MENYLLWFCQNVKESCWLPIYSESDEDNILEENIGMGTNNFKIGNHVLIVNKPFKGYYAVITAQSYGDKWEINYYEKRQNCYILKENDFDSREKKDVKKVYAEIDNLLRVNFKISYCIKAYVFSFILTYILVYFTCDCNFLERKNIFQKCLRIHFFDE